MYGTIKPEIWQLWNQEIKTECENSSNLCIAVFTMNGELLFANDGMKMLFLDSPRESFLNPGFDTIAEYVSDNPLIFKGFITIGKRNSSRNISIQARVFRRGGQLLITGEIDVRQLVSVNEQLLDLNSEVSNLQRKLIKEKAELTRTLQQLRESELKIKSLLSEKELLLMEVHHRIKNNMGTIRGLLYLQGETLKNSPAAAAAVHDAENRVHSMMMLYNKLYTSQDFREISLKSYLEPLVDEIIRNFPNSGIVRIDKNISDFHLDINISFPLGIIVNELLTNIMKYAFTGRESGIITVTASINKNHVCLAIEDNGVGIPESVSFINPAGFGMELVSMLTEQIAGSIRIERGDGTKFIIEFDI